MDNCLPTGSKIAEICIGFSQKPVIDIGNIGFIFDGIKYCTACYQLPVAVFNNTGTNCRTPFCRKTSYIRRVYVSFGVKVISQCFFGNIPYNAFTAIGNIAKVGISFIGKFSINIGNVSFVFNSIINSPPCYNIRIAFRNRTVFLTLITSSAIIMPSPAVYAAPPSGSADKSTSTLLPLLDCRESCFVSAL